MCVMNKEEKVLTTGTAVVNWHYTGYSAPLFSLPSSLSLPTSVTSNHVAIVMLEVTDASCHIVSIILHPFSLHTSVKVSVCEKEDR